MNATIKSITVGLLSLMFIISCSGTSDVTGPSDPDKNLTPATPRMLVTYPNDADLLTEIQNKTIDELETTLDNYYSCWNDGYDDGEVSTMSEPTSSADSGGSTTSSADTATESTEPSVTFTDTNIQEDGVDEADTVKTDGKTLFVATNSGVDVFNVNPDESFTKITTYEIEEGVQQLFLQNSKLVILQSGYYEKSYLTTATVLDVSNPEKPITGNSTSIEGYYTDARLIDGTLHLITSSSMAYNDITYPEWSYEKYRVMCEDDYSTFSKAEILAELESAKEENRQKILATSLADWLPEIKTDQVSATLSAEAVFWDQISTGSSLTAITSITLDSQLLKTSLIKGATQEVYVSTHAIYLAATRYENTNDEIVWSSTADATYTDIHRFALSANTLHDYQGSGSVFGWLLNRFAMSEYQDHLRVATTVGHASRSGSSESYSNVYVLDATKDNLETIGKVENIAPDEQIYSARFIGDRGYIVTFKKVDPLFVINLENPGSPFVQGELEIPGYSTYLHPIDANHLIGLGKDADDMGDFAWYQGIKISLFDVSNDENPMETDNIIIGSRGTESPALTDPHAFTFESSTGKLALPISLSEGGNGGSDHGDFQYFGVHVYQISAATGIATLAEIEISEAQGAPQRTLFISNAASGRLFVIDHQNIYAYDSETYDFIDSIDLSNTNTDSVCYDDICWSGI